MISESNENVKLALETIVKILKKQNELYTRKILELQNNFIENIVQNSNGLNMLNKILVKNEILADEELAEEFKDTILEMADERLKSAMLRIFNIDEFQLDKPELEDLYTDLKELIKLI